MEKTYFIVNPASGKGRGEKIIPKLKSVLSKNTYKNEVIVTQKPKHAIEISNEISNNSSGVIVAVGGDGTVNEVINGINLEKDNILGVLPVGSGNDFIKNIGLKKNFNHDLNLITETKNRNLKKVDLGYVNFRRKNIEKIEKKVFSNAIGIGFDAQVAHLNQTNKKLSGIISYVNAVFRSLKDLNYLDLKLNFNDIEIKGEKLLVTIGNGTCSGGGFYLNPNAIIDDGKLDITVIEKITKSRLVRALPKALINRLETVKEANMYKCEDAKIFLNNSAFVHTDGESLGNDIIVIDVSIMKKKVKFITA